MSVEMRKRKMNCLRMGEKSEANGVEGMNEMVSIRRRRTREIYNFAIYHLFYVIREENFNSVTAFTFFGDTVST